MLKLHFFLIQAAVYSTAVKYVGRSESNASYLFPWKLQ